MASERFDEATCVVCGCTEDRACPPTAERRMPCHWIVLHDTVEFGPHGVCSSCTSSSGDALLLLSCYKTTQRFPANSPFHENALFKLNQARQRRGIAA